MTAPSSSPASSSALTKSEEDLHGKSTVDDYVRTTFYVATNVADETAISTRQMDEVIDYLK